MNSVDHSRRRARERRVALVATLLALAVVTPAGAAAFTVDSVNDGVDATPGDGICATTQATCTIRAAIQEANALEGEDIVIIPSTPPPSLYNLTLNGGNEDAGSTGDLDITDDLILRGMGAGSITIISTSTDRVFEVMPDVDVTMFGFMIQDGDARPANGGGILNQGQLTIRELTIRSCDATNGGGIANIGTATLQLTNVTISGNHALEQGGALFNVNQATAVLLNVTLANNTAGAGAGIFNLVQSTAELPSVTLQNTILSHQGQASGDCGGAPVHSLGNNIPSSSTCFLDHPDDFGPLNAALGPLVFGGGRSSTHALLANSPAIDAAAPSACPETDQREFLRPADGDGDLIPVCDIGAYEFAAISPTPTPTLSRTPTLSPTPTGTLPPSETPTDTPTPTVTDTEVPLATPTTTPTTSPSLTVTPSLTLTPSRTATPSLTTTPSRTATITPTPVLSFTPTTTATIAITDTPAPTSTSTPTVSQTATFTASPTVTATAAPPQLIVGDAAGAPGETVSFDVALRTGSFDVSSASNELTFDPLNVPIARLANGRPDCDAADGFGSAFRFRPTDCAGLACTSISASVLQLTFPLEAIPDGTVLYTCRVAIAEDAPEASFPMTISAIVIADLQGARIDGAVGAGGSITVVENDCLGDCNGDGMVTVDELVRLVSIALGSASLETCPAADGNDDSAVTVDEIVTAVTNALNGCPL